MHNKVVSNTGGMKMKRFKTGDRVTLRTKEDILTDKKLLRIGYIKGKKV